MESYLESLYHVAEDVVRLDPWHRQLSPFVLRDGQDYVLVSFENHGPSQIIRFYRGDDGIRAYFLSQQEPSGQALERVAEWTAAAYWEVVDQPFKMTEWEKDNAQGQDRTLAFRAKKAHVPPKALAKSHAAKLLVYLRALRKILSQDDDSSLQKKVGGQNEIRLPAYDLQDKKEMTLKEIVLRPFGKVADREPVIDEFTAARLRYAPVDEDRYELYFFYLPITTEDKVRPYFLTTVFLVNLSDGIIEWSDVLPQSPHFRKDLLEKLFAFWLDRGGAPAGVLCAKRHLYDSLYPDFRQAGIPFEKISQSYVGAELIQTYMASSKIKPGHYDSLQVPTR